MSDLCLPYKVVDGRRVPISRETGEPIKPIRPVGGPIALTDVEVTRARALFTAKEKDNEPN